MNRFPFTSVTRWLLVVIGCAVLATAQPMSAASSDATAPDSRKADTIIYPKGSGEKPTGTAGAADRQGATGSYVLVIALVLAGVGAWVLLQRRKGAPIVSRGPRKLQLEETRPLGNRQYLVVANYEGRKFLLGVTTGQIQLLSELGAEGTAAGEGQK